MDKSVEIENIVLVLYESMSKGDIGALEDMFSWQYGVLVIGSDPAEWWAGHETILRAFTTQLREAGAKQIQMGEIHAFVEGTVGWASELRTISQAKGKEMKVRHTFVFHLEDGKWKIVQLHVSIGVPNAELREQGQSI